MNHAQFWGGGGAAPYEIEQSLRFDGSSYLTHTHGSTPTGDNGTLSVWVKRRGTNYDYDTIIEGAPSNGRGAHYLRNVTSGNDGRIDMHQFFPDNGGIDGGQVPDAQLRDPSAWYHLLWQHQNTGTRTLGDRLWINGVLQTDLTYPGVYNAQPWAVTRNGNTATIGRYFFTYGYLHGYLAEMHCIDGSLVAVDQFGEYDDNGVWRPIEYTGSYGNNGFYLKFDPTATNGIGHDHSGNGNNFSPSGFTTSGTGTDVMSDTPTNNFPTLNPLYTTPPYPTQTESGTLSDGNLAITFNGVNGGRGVTFAEVPTSGKWYFEAKQTSSDNTNISLGFFGNYTANFSNAWRIIHTNGGGGFIYSFQGPESGSEPSGSVSYSSGNVLGIEIDMDNSTLQYHVNGTYSTKATGLSFASYAPLLMDFRRQNSSGTNNSWLFNFGQRAFEYTPTSGFKALNTSNLPAPTVKDGSDYFNTVLYTGNGSTTQTITGVGFNPDFTWIKNRDVGRAHNVYDVVRGDGKKLKTNLTEAESDVGTDFSFQTDGFFVGNRTETNENNVAIVAWNWLAGGSGSSNTDGSITSTVSANPSAGFSIATYTGNGTAGATVGHGLGVAPKMIMVKRRDTGADWAVYHASTGATKYLTLNNTNSAGTSSAYWNNTEPTSTVFSLGLSSEANTNAATFVAYCFSEVAGYSKFGSYVGNGNADGPFVYCGFRPAWVLIKNSNSATDWHLFDTARDPSNEVTQALYPDTSGSEDTLTNNEIDILSNGFKLKSAGGSTNGSGNTLIFAAFSENPFGGSGVSPATAR